MGLVSSRLNLEGLHTGRRRSQQDETLYSYSLNKNYFSNYFLMGGERFEVNDPDYLFGDNCDLNFLSCTKPYSLPYKQAQQNLLSNLNTKQKAINKVSGRVSRLSSSFNILTGRRGQAPNSGRKQDTQTQILQNSKRLAKGSEPSQPLVMFVNIRKETLRLVKLSTVYNLDSDLNSLTNSLTISAIDQKTIIKLTKRRTSTKQQPPQHSSNRYSTASSRATTATIYPNEVAHYVDDDAGDDIDDDIDDDLGTSHSRPRKFESDVGSILSASSTRSGYTSVKGDGSPSDDSSDDNDEDFKDALNDTTNLSIKEDDDNDNDSEKTQQQRSLLRETNSTKENRDIKITIGPLDDTNASNSSDTKQTDQPAVENCEGDENFPNYSTPRSKRTSSRRLTKPPLKTTDDVAENSSNRVYNIEFEFDAEVDCSIRIFYFCTRELTSNGITYKPQHATYKSKIYHYKKGLNQKFDQQEHTFQPYLFDEDLLIYKPLDLDGNYNSGAVFPIVIHCVALEGSIPRQSHSLVATIEKSQLDDSYSIKPLKQLIFVDGVQYILQDIYGIEHKQLPSSIGSTTGKTQRTSIGNNPNLKGKSHSLQSNLNGSNLNLSDTASVTSVNLSLSNRQNRSSLISNNQHKSLTSDNTFECVICMSEERDTMLLPCRHLCLCSSCAQSLRYQASSCPICRCHFKAALNLRPIQKHSYSTSSIAAKTLVTSSSPTVSTSLSKSAIKQSSQDAAFNSSISLKAKKAHQVSSNSISLTNDDNGIGIKNNNASRRESVTNSTTPLLSAAPLDVVVNLDNNVCNTSSVTTTKVIPNNTVSNYRSMADGGLVGGPPMLNTTTLPNDLESLNCQSVGESGSLEMRSMNVQWNKNTKP